MGDCQFPAKVKIVEVGPRDGLQNEFHFVHTKDKLEFIKKLVQAGHQHVEATSFVRKDRIRGTPRDCL